MSTRVAINGLGRIGRAILKLVFDESTFELVAVNDLVDVENLAYLLRFDTVYGRYPMPLAVDAGHLVIGGRRVRTLQSREPSLLPWRELGVDLVFECTGALTRPEDLAGCGKITVLDGSNRETASRLARLSPRWATGAGSPPRPYHAAGTSRLSRTRL